MSVEPAPLECVVEVAIEPKSKADRDKLGLALVDLASEDRSFRFAIDHEFGQVIIKGVSEFHLDDKIDTLRRSYAVDLNISELRIAYRETLTKRIEMDYTHKVRDPGAGRFVRLKFIFEPYENSGFSVDATIRGVVPAMCVEGAEAGINSVMMSGGRAGFPLVGVRATLVAAIFNEGHATPAVFEIIARTAFRQAFEESAVLLEPVMRLEITAPEDYLGFIKGDVLARSGNLLRERVHDGIAVFEATAPLSNLFGYANQLRSGTQGQGKVTMRFASYQPVPDLHGGNPPPVVAAAVSA